MPVIQSSSCCGRTSFSVRRSNDYYASVGDAFGVGRALQAESSEQWLVLRFCIRPLRGADRSWPSWIYARVRSHSRIGPRRPVGSPDHERDGETVLPFFSRDTILVRATFSRSTISPRASEADGGARQASCGRQRQAGLDVAGHLRIRSAAIVLFFRLMFSRDALGQGSKLSDAHPLDQRRLAVWALRLGSGSNKRAKSDVIYLPSCPLGQPDADLPVSIPPFGIARMVQFFGKLLGCPPNPRPITVVVGMMSLPAYTSSRMEHP